MKKRVLSFVLTMTMLLALLPAGLVSVAATQPQAGKILYDCGYGLTIIDDTVYSVGDEVCLKDDLRGQLQHDGLYDVTFYGWEIDEVTYQPGDRIPMSETGLVAHAVWVRAVCVDANATGENADGSREHPFNDPDEAYLYLIQLADDSNSSYDAIAFYLLSDVEWIIDDYVTTTNFEYDDTILLYGTLKTDSNTGNTYYDYYCFRMRGVDLPVLFTAASDDTVLQFTDPQETKMVTYFNVYGEVLFDGITMKMNTKQNTRFLPMRGATFGMRFTIAGVTESQRTGVAGSYGIFLDFTSQSSAHLCQRVYGGIYQYIIYGHSNASYSSEIFVGTVDSRVVVGRINGANSTMKSTDLLHLYNCYLPDGLIIGALDNYGNVSCYNKVTAILYAGAKVNNIYDFGSANTANNPNYLANVKRNLIFDGFSGGVKWNHLPLTNNSTANGLDAIVLKNGAQVKITGVSPTVRDGGTLSIEQGSSFASESLLPVGVSMVDGKEVALPYGILENGVEYTFEKNLWLATFGDTLGCSIRVKEPYGLRFGFEMDSAVAEALTGRTVLRRGVLMVPEVLLTSQALTRETQNIIDVNAPLPISPDKPNQFTGCLVDSLESPNVAWLDIWANVIFLSRGYLLLDDGGVIYTDVIRNSIQNVWDILDSKSEFDENDDWSDFVGVEVKNETGVTDITSRAYYPDAYKFLSELETLRKAVGKDVKNKTLIRSELGRLLADCTDLGLYSDYYHQTFATAGNTYFGAKEETNPIGGGVGYVSGISGAATYTVTDDNTLKAALDKAKSGDIILVSGDITIDLADFILAGDPEGFDGSKPGYTKIEYQFTVPAGVTLMGERGTNGKKGAVLKTTSYVENMFFMEEGSRMSGLVLMGPDQATDDSIGGENLSGAIKVIGDNVKIDNCEIAGFYRSFVVAREVVGLTFENNYFHHCLGNTTGVAIDLYNTDAVISGNLFTNLRRIASIGGKESDVVFSGNVESSNDETTLILLRVSGGLDLSYPSMRQSISTLTVEHNAFFSKANPFYFGGLVQKVFTLTNNWFVYPESAYSDNQLLPGGSAFALATKRGVAQNNLFGVSSPVVLSKDLAFDEVPEDGRFGSYSAAVGIAVSLPDAKVNAKANLSYSQKLQAPVLSASYYSDNADLPYTTLENLIASCESGSDAQIIQGIEQIMQGIGCYSNFLSWKDNGNISMEVYGQTYGAYEYNDEPFAGGVGYSEIFTTGDYIVTNETELRAALEVAKSGEVIFIPGYVQMELGDANQGICKTLNIPQGVTLASNRGYVYPDGTISTGALLTTSVFSSTPMITVAMPDIRITGLTIQGPDPGQHLAHHKRSFTTYSETTHGHAYYYQLRTVTGVQVTADNFRFDNCEISAFNNVAIALRPKNSGVAIVNAKIHNNYIHHNQINGLGYGVSLTKAYCEVYSNYFNYNRHSIAGSGYPDSGYKAFCNVEFGASLSTYFDMHGGYDRNKTYVEEFAGEYVEIYHNTFLGDREPFNLRGFPTSHRTFEYNICYLPFDSYGKIKYTGVDENGESIIWLNGNRLTHYWYRDVLVTNNYIGKNIWNAKQSPVMMDHGYGDNYNSTPDGWGSLVS